MRILLLGEYSNVHNGLSEGLKKLGHDVCVISDGDGWKNYHCDINISRKSVKFFDSLRYIAKIRKVIHSIRDYDIVQIINPMFLELRAERIKPYYEYIRKHNKKVVLGAYGMDYYWVKTCLDCKTFRYSDFNFGSNPRTDEYYNKGYIKDWIDGEKGILNKFIANDCNGIVCGLYEYYKCYNPVFPQKSTFIPFPINTDDTEIRSHRHEPNAPIRFFIGIQKDRHEYKGTDIMLRALERVKSEIPDRCEIVKAESVPFEKYKIMLDSADVLLDQLYSYTPGMNGLLAMSKGIVLVGGGEEEHYELLHEESLRPIINVLPNEDDVYCKLKELVNNPSIIDKLSQESVQYIHKHHNYIKVAEEYIRFWNSL